jgi:hypothetical protein
MESKDILEGNVLVNLLTKKAYSEETAVYLSELGVSEKDLGRLKTDNRIMMITHSPTKVYLTRMGKIIAAGECSLRFRARAKK